MENVYKFLINESGIKSGDFVVIGVSGGPDSMALLHVMNKIKKELNISLICAHINHNVREESEAERIFLQNYCEKQGIIFEHMKIEKYGDDNFHNEARTIRYNFFEKVINHYNAKFLLTAHHGDDLMETILMRVVRGSTLKGYSGFSKIVEKEGYKILRPFITLTKTDIEKYNKANKIKYVVDKSNFKDVYTRNRYRKYLLPFLKSEDPHVHLKFLKFSETLLETNEYINNQMNCVRNKVLKQGSIDIEKFKELEKVIQIKIIYSLLEAIYCDDLIIINDAHVNLILSLIKSNKASSLIHLPNNVICTKSYNNLSFSFYEPLNEQYEIELTDMVNLPNGKNIEVVESSEWGNNFVTRLSSKEVSLPLYVRTRKNGDKIEIKKMRGSKKVNDIFINEKVTIEERNSWPIVLDSKDNIVWLPGLRKTKFDKEKNEEYDIVLRYY